MEDTSTVELLRDIALIVASGVIIICLLVLTVLLLSTYKHVRGMLTAVRQTAENMQEAAQAVANVAKGINPVPGTLASGLVKVAGMLFRNATRRSGKSKAK